MYVCSSQSTKQQQRRRRWLRQHPRAATINNQPTFNFKKIKYKKAPTKRCIILYHIYHTVLFKDEETRGSKGPAPEVQKASSKVVESREQGVCEPDRYRFNRPRSKRPIYGQCSDERKSIVPHVCRRSDQYSNQSFDETFRGGKSKKNRYAPFSSW